MVIIIDTRSDGQIPDLVTCPICGDVADNRYDLQSVDDNGACESCCMESWRNQTAQLQVSSDFGQPISDSDIPF